MTDFPTSANSPVSVDVLIQTFNEEENLPHVLASIAGWANRVFVVDSGSTDGTRQIAEAAGATFVHHDWEGYAGQKNWALANLPWSANWTLILDADEALTPELRDEITRVVTKDPNEVHESGFHLNRVFVFMGRKIWHCGYFPSWNLRLFKRGKARYEERLVHEHMIVDGPTGYLNKLILHEDRRGLEHFFAKHNRYSTLEARELFEHPEPWPGMMKLMLDRTPRRRFLKSRVLPFLPMPWIWRLIYMYVVRLGFLDGRAGWQLSNFISTYEFFIQLKYQEIGLLQGKQKIVRNALAKPEGSVAVDDERPQTPQVAAVHDAVDDAPTGVTTTKEVVEFKVPSPDAPRVVPEPEEVPLSTGNVIESSAPRPNVARAPVSVIIPTLNEASNIASCLAHLQWADEVVVVDSGSRDDTVKISEQAGAKVVQFKWNGQWPKKKNWALRHAPLKHEWVLIVDADEWITADLAREIQEVIKSDKHVGWYINRKFIFMGRWIKRCGYYPSWNLRLIKRGQGEYEQLTGIGNTGSGDNEVHEHIIANGSVGYLNEDMLHFAFPNIHTFMEKHNRYSNWEAAVQFKGVSHGSSVVDNAQLSKRRKLKELSRRMPFRPTLRFLYSYIWQGGFLDGVPGYVFCRLLAIYEYLSVAKYQELKRAQSDAYSVKAIAAKSAVGFGTQSAGSGSGL